MPILLKNVHYTYMPHTPFAQHALGGVNLTIGEGEFAAVIGHTGSGKSTLLQQMKGLLVPTKGTVLVDGVDLGQKTQAAKAAKASVGMVFQYPEQQIFEETVFDDVAFGPRNMGLPEGEVEQRVRRALRLVQLDPIVYKERSPFELSGGQRRRVALAGVFAMQPKYLLLDEPAAGLDPIGKREIFSNLMELNERAGTAVLFISHDMDDVAKFARRLLVMESGRLVFDGAPKEVFAEKEKLQAMGLDIPSAAKLLDILAAKGVAVKKRALTVDDAVQEILHVIGGKTNA